MISAVQMASGKRVRAYIAAPNEIDAALERLYGGGKSSMGQIVDNIATRTDDDQELGDIAHLKDLASEAPVIRLVNLLLHQGARAARLRHPHRAVREPPRSCATASTACCTRSSRRRAGSRAAVISRVKIMASLDIAERRLPQDGRIKLRIQGKEIDLRVSTVPTMHGESVVMRILDKGGVPLNFESLGFEGEPLRKFLDVLDQPHGILLVTGPTG